MRLRGGAAEQDMGPRIGRDPSGQEARSEPWGTPASEQRPCPRLSGVWVVSGAGPQGRLLCGQSPAQGP